MVSLGVGTEGDDGDGLSEEDIEKAEKNLEKIAEKLDCKLSLLRTKDVSEGRQTRDFLLRKRLEDEADFWLVSKKVFQKFFSKEYFKKKFKTKFSMIMFF